MNLTESMCAVYVVPLFSLFFRPPSNDRPFSTWEVSGHFSISAPQAPYSDRHAKVQSGPMDEVLTTSYESLLAGAFL